MKKSLVLIFAAAIGLSACNNFKKGPSGTLYQIHKSGGKEKIKVGDFVKFNFIQENDKDSLIKSTFDVGQPAVFKVPPRTYPGDVNDVLTFFGEGDSATFKVNLDTMAAKSGQPKGADIKSKYVVFHIKIDKVLSPLPNEADSVFNKRASNFFQEDYKQAMLKLKSSEAAKIKNYETANNLKMTVSPTGLHYIITAPGTGAKPVFGDTVMVDYTGKFTNKKSDGKEYIFETTDAKTAKQFMPPNPGAIYQPAPLIIGQAIKGMEEAIEMLSIGGKMTVIIPSSLGYGEMGSQPVIPPYAPLVFDLEVKGIKKPNTRPVMPTAPAVKP